LGGGQYPCGKEHSGEGGDLRGKLPVGGTLLTIHGKMVSRGGEVQVVRTQARVH